MACFPRIEEIKYEGTNTKDMYAFQHYNPEEITMGKTMKEYLRFAVVHWHTMTRDGSDTFGKAVNKRSWLGESPVETAKERVIAFFEILGKLDVKYFCFHDIDIAPEGNSLERFFSNIDEITGLIKEKMDEAGIKLLWNTANMFSDPRCVNGAVPTNNTNAYATAAARVKEGLDVSKRLGGENYVFWGGREGYETLLNTDMKFEQDNIMRLFKMTIFYGEKIGHKPQFLIEPKPKEPSKRQYDLNTATAMAFILKYGLEGDLKLNLEANHATLAGHTSEHELNVAWNYGALGSIDANQGDVLLGWDADEFPTNVYDVTLAMYRILGNGGTEPGGINFDSKVRRSPFEMKDLLLAHIVGMDTFAKGLKSVMKLKEDRFFEDLKKQRYSSFKKGIGAKTISGKENLGSLTNYTLKNDKPIIESSHIEYIKSILNDYLY